MDFLWHLIIIFGTWIPSVTTYTLIFGKGKMLHFGPVGVSLFTAYVTILLATATGSSVLGLLGGLCGALLLSALFAWLSLRLEADAFGVMSIAVHLGIIAIILNWSSLTRGALGISRIPRAPFPTSLFLFAMVMTVMSILWILAILAIDRSSFGRQLSALAEHKWHAMSLGIERVRVHFLAFAIGAFSSVLATFSYLHYVGLLHPNDFQFPAFILYVMFVVAGKPGSILGSTLAIILLVLLKEGLRFVPQFLPISVSVIGPLQLILFGLILFGAVWWRRDILFVKQRTI
jgi:branched-chain amino acid transport system permease protein